MPSESVQPLRISKTSPTKMAGGSFQRPLSEISSTSQRRNSPSFNQTTRKMILNKESSPFDSSQFGSSPRLFWRGRDGTSPGPGLFSSENSFEREPSVSPKRASIENLKKASRVKNSSMFAREQNNEYDPTRVPQVERPLAVGRPLAYNSQSPAKENMEHNANGHRRGESLTGVPILSPSSSPVKATSSPSKDAASPTKSSLSSSGRFSSMGRPYDQETSIWSEDGDQFKSLPSRPLRRHAKSVTFDAAPPQINEYEMVTPDPSSIASGSREGSYDSMDEYDEEDMSFDQDNSMDRDDSFDASLEDTDKTPVVLPEDWRHMSPDVANTSLADAFDDPFDGHDVSPRSGAQSHAREHTPVREHTPLRETTPLREHTPLRNNSITSNSSSRPLPPLPPMPSSSGKARRESGIGVAAAAERVNSARRSLPSPPAPASISKSDLLSMRDASMSLEDRLGLMGIRDPSKSYEEEETETPKSSSSQGTVGLGIQVHEDTVMDETDISALEDFKVPRISRDSILRKVKSQNFDDADFQYDPEDTPERSYGDLADLDPDVPIPSREASSQFDEIVPDVHIKEENDDSMVDVYSIPDMYSVEPSPARGEDYERESSVIHHDIPQSDEEEEVDDDDDDMSRYSGEEEEKAPSHSTSEDEGPPTPKAATSVPPKEDESERFEQNPMSLPELGALLGNEEFNFQLGTYGSLVKEEDKRQSPVQAPPKLDTMRHYLERPTTPGNERSSPVSPLEEDLEPPRFPTNGDNDDGRSTPDSVIHHTIEPALRESPDIPEPIATIKAPGSKLKTRPSISPADAATMAAVRRQVSSEHPPPIPQRSPKRQSLCIDIENPDASAEAAMAEAGMSPKPKRRESIKMKLDFAVDSGDDLSFGLDREFDRVMEAQKKGYLTRHTTKMVVASSRQFSDEKPPTRDGDIVRGGRTTNNSPRKMGHDRSQSWTTEPWNGKVRRKSLRQASGTTGHKKAASGPVPPLPGQESNVAAGLDPVAEDQMGFNDDPEGVERGRLFVKVVGVKDLDLPLPKNEQTHFQLTLDNGLHCVTTSWLDLNRSAPIGQEFELVVLNELEFQLTLQTKLEPPAKPQVVPPTPVKGINHKKSTSALNRLLMSPKKRKEQERKQQEADRAAQQQEMKAKRASTQPTAWDLLHDLVAPDGSFARAYVCLKNHEPQAYGRPLTVDLPLFNEWAVEDASMASSVKSKRGGVVRRPPYRIGKLTLQLLYVPKPKGAKEEDMPKSMNACIREMKEAEEVRSRVWEGHLSQQGGDCPYWRRRFFRLSGTKLTAFHETTRQPRATINLSKASKLIDDRSALTQPSATKNGGRRKSAFAEEEEGYMFVEEGFRIRFANGEVIDFYADNAQDKEDWMKVLSETVGKELPNGSKAWTEMIFDKERKDNKNGASASSAKHKSMPPAPIQTAPAISGTRSAPTSPQEESKEQPPPPIEKSPRHEREAKSAARKQVRSMLF